LKRLIYCGIRKLEVVEPHFRRLIYQISVYCILGFEHSFLLGFGQLFDLSFLGELFDFFGGFLKAFRVLR
jgi:hypothetical protein